MCCYGWLLFCCISCFVLSEEHVLQGSHTLARFKRQYNRCRTNPMFGEFQCVSGQCVSENQICDGTEDCTDGTDENDCANFPCPLFGFRCAYGACIGAEHVCDGKKNCKDNSDETHPNCTTSTCSGFQFACDRGRCIDDANLCDGKADCEDATDESWRTCGKLSCPLYAFRCDYGACINSDLKCNGKNDCHDGSDEKSCPETPDLVSKQEECKLPAHPTNGKWQVYGVSNAYIPGDSVATGTILQYKCNEEYALSPSNALSICSGVWSAEPKCVSRSSNPTVRGPGGCKLPKHPPNGQWEVAGNKNRLYMPGDFVDQDTILTFRCKSRYALDPHDEKTASCNGVWTKIPRCLITCAAATPSKHMTVQCSLNGFRVDCTTPVDGTLAMFKCSPFYEDWRLEQIPYRFCSEGSWDYPQPQCSPMCGLKSTEAATLVIGGTPSQRGEYPWVVGVYRTNDTQHFCGGSMITPKITLSAAHCFESSDPKLYMVAAGKYHRPYRHELDKDAQYSNLADVKIHADYNKGQPYQAFDIAIVVLETPFTITKFVMPVCIEYNPGFQEATLGGTNGVVAGWGYTTASGSPSNVLKELQLSYKTYDQCKLPEDVRNYFTAARDKMCAGSVKSGDNLCEGDSGGGLVFQHRQRYYIRGIVSVGIADKLNFGCDVNELVLFTSVAFHAEFIQRNL